MKSKFIAVLLTFILAFGLCACTDAETLQPDMNSADVPDEKNVVLSDVRTSVIEQMGVAEPLLIESEMLFDLYGISSDLLTQSAGFVTMSGTFPDEVIFTEAANEAAAEAVQAALQKRLDEVLVQSKTYDAENYAAAQSCKVSRNGLFVALILSPKQAEMTVIYDGFLA